MLRFLTPAAFAVATLAAPSARADIVKLAGGGELRGVLVEPDSESPQADTAVVTIETLTGGIVSVSRSEVEFITRRPRLVEEYEIRAKTTAATVEAQWQLAEWCLEQGLEEQRRDCLLRVVALESDHPEARQALGQTLHDGEWMTHAEKMLDRGLVEHEGRWITPEERDLIQRTDAEREREQAWFSEIRKLRGWLRSSNDELRRKGYDGLQQITDPDAVPALSKNFRDDPDPEVRTFYVSILAGMDGPKPVQAIVTQSLHDVSRQVREAAFEAIDESRSETALPWYLQGLRNDANLVVRRAGRGLEQIADERAIPDLIKALITTHRYRVRVPDTSPVISFSRGGTFGSGGIPLPPDVDLALRAGALPHGVRVVDLSQPPVQTRLVTLSVNEENPEVLAALQKITGESFGFDERTWRLWWAAKKNGAG